MRDRPSAASVPKAVPVSNSNRDFFDSDTDTVISQSEGKSALPIGLRNVLMKRVQRAIRPLSKKSREYDDPKVVTVVDRFIQRTSKKTCQVTNEGRIA